jgi:hypothetical protein
MNSGEIQNEPNRPICVPWYENKTSYEAVLRLVPTSENDGALSYDHWCAFIENKEKMFKRQGLIPYRIPVEAVALKEYCDANNKPVCGASIVEYATIILKLRLESQQRAN